MECPDGLVWNAKENFCDSARNVVGCSGPVGDVFEDYYDESIEESSEHEASETIEIIPEVFNTK